MSKKITLADRLLVKFASMPRSTANEVGMDGLRLVGVQLSSAQKRATDLVKRGYLQQTDRRECLKSGKLAQEFSITSHGINYLRSKNIMPANISNSNHINANKTKTKTKMTDKSIGKSALRLAREALV